MKRYIDEPHSEAVAHLMDKTLAVGTSPISRVEVGPPSRERPAESASTPKGLAEPGNSSQTTGRTLARYP